MSWPTSRIGAAAVFVCALAFASVAPAQLNYDPPHAGPTASFRDYGIQVDQTNRAGDEGDFYQELAPLGPVSIDKTFQYVTQDGDTGGGRVQFQSDADPYRIQFSGSASATANGSSPNLGSLSVSAYTAQQWIFDVSAPMTLQIEALISTTDNDSWSESFFTLFRDDAPAVFDYTIDRDNSTLDLTGSNALAIELQPETMYTLLLQAFAYQSITPGQTGSVQFDVTATVPEPGGVAMLAALGAWTVRRRRGR